MTTVDEMPGLVRARQGVAKAAGWEWCEEHQRARFDGHGSCSPLHNKPCGHCRRDTDEAYLLPCPFDAKHCSLCNVCKMDADADKMDADADYGPLGYGAQGEDAQ